MPPGMGALQYFGSGIPVGFPFRRTSIATESRLLLRKGRVAHEAFVSRVEGTTAGVMKKFEAIALQMRSLGNRRGGLRCTRRGQFFQGECRPGGCKEVSQVVSPDDCLLVPVSESAGSQIEGMRLGLNKHGSRQLSLMSKKVSNFLAAHAVPVADGCVAGARESQL